MEFSGLFLGVLIVMLASWYGARIAGAGAVRPGAHRIGRDAAAPRHRHPEAVVLGAPVTRSTAITLNALGLYGVALVLAIAFGAQLWLHELPCPLCLLQRMQFAMLAIGPILNIRFGPRPSHYGISLLAALLGAAVAARQIFLHILPGDPGFGSALFGYHYYTWAFIGFTAAIVLIAADAAVRPAV